MRKEKKSLFLIVLSLFLCISSVKIPAKEERSIFVGDLIKIRIQSEEISRTELEEKFNEFEIVDINEDKSGYILTLRTFDPGEKTVQIGNKEIKISVKSTLDEIKEEKVFEGETNTERAGFYFPWLYLLIALSIVFLVSTALSLNKYLGKRKFSRLTPYERFIKRLQDIPVDDYYLVRLTLCFKQYVEESYSYSIRGKTSVEIIKEIDHIEDLQARIPAIQSWLQESDYFKYTKHAPSFDEKNQMEQKLKELVKEIESSKKPEVSKKNAR